MNLNQAFWGNCGSGYQLCGTTAPEMNNIIESLCGIFGTYDGFSENSPFLFSKPEKELVFMGCCQQGRADFSGRNTKIYHIIFASASECSRLEINAYSLFKNGFFTKEIPKDLLPLTISKTLKCNFIVPTFKWDGLPLVMESQKPENDQICALIKDRINDVAWAGFSYKPLKNFLIYALPEKCKLPVSSKLPLELSSEKKESLPMSQTTVMDSSKCKFKGSKIYILLFFLSLLGNVLLCFLLYFSKKQLDLPVERRQNYFNFKAELQHTVTIKKIIEDQGKHDPEDFAFLKKVEKCINKQD